MIETEMWKQMKCSHVYCTRPEKKDDFRSEDFKYVSSSFLQEIHISGQFQ